MKILKKSLKKQYNFSEFSKVWRGIGPVIDQELSAKRGVDVPKLGKFTFNAAGKPIFIVSNILPGIHEPCKQNHH